ncbi:hypothetical protein C1646_709686, partial [Rhizophagus diaphanus]
MAHLQNGRFKYRDDLGGLCLICNDYAYQPFEDLIKLVSNNIMNKKTKEKLTCYLVHQTQKKYLNEQFNAVLDELDDHGAIIVVDYKMRILLAIARETKSEFFRKRDWTLHTTLIFQKKTIKKWMS